MKNKLLGVVMLTLAVNNIAPFGVAQVKAEINEETCTSSAMVIFKRPTTFRVGAPAIMFLRWRDAPWGNERIRVKLQQGRVRVIEAKGTVIEKADTPACRRDLRRVFSRSDLPIKTINKLVRAGLVVRLQEGR